MRIKVTGRGIYGGGGEIGIGTEIDVRNVPAGWAGRYEVITGNPVPAAKAIVNDGFKIVDKGRGWFVITKGRDEVTKSLRADDVEGFDEMSAEDKAAFVELNKAG
jgi:hypothetical protein